MKFMNIVVIIRRQVWNIEGDSFEVRGYMDSVVCNVPARL